MSNVYQYEPAVNGLVVIETTMGDIEVGPSCSSRIQARRGLTGFRLNPDRALVQGGS